MKASFRISLFKITLVFFLCLIGKHVFFFIAGFLYLWFHRKENVIVLLMFFLLLCLCRNIPKDPLSCGIIDYPVKDGYLVDKGLYKIILYTEDDLHPGDILYFKDRGEPFDDYHLSQLVLYHQESYELITSFPLRQMIYEKVLSFQEETVSLMKWFFYHLRDGNSTLEDAFFFASYIFLSKLIRKNRIPGSICLIIHVLLFCGHCRYSILFLDLLLSFLPLEKKEIPLLESVILYCLYTSLSGNTGILLNLLLRFLIHVDLSLNQREMMIILQSLFFHKVSLTGLYFFNVMRRIYVFFLIALYAVLVFRFPEGAVLYLWHLFQAISGLLARFSIKGSYTAVSLLFFFLIRHLDVSKKIPMTVILLLLLFPPFHHPLCEIAFLDVGQGDAILFRSFLGMENILIDTGSPFNYYDLREELDERGIYTIHHLIITHDDADHNGNLISLEKDYRVLDVVEEGRDIEGRFLLTYLSCGNHENDNDNSLVYYTKMNETSFLFTGDISKSVERELIDRYGDLSVDVLKASHHGSCTGSSDYFISRILPKDAVISTNGRYGHPHRSTMRTLEKYGVRILSTKDSGTIRYLFLRGISFNLEEREWYNIFI